MEAEQRLQGGECSTTSFTTQSTHQFQHIRTTNQQSQISSNRDISKKCFALFLMIVCLMCLISPIEAARERRPKSGCSKLRNPIVAELLEKVCLMCHEMYSHDKPNLHAHCRKSCFRNPVFEECAKQFGSQQPLSGLPFDRQTLSFSGASL
ncbi:unnamed protein product, partial [Mesorhabditis belari]|uniref:Uncharacterized protein n=1 Tax=Mesorhabditis belari TaxID=2138241 RepID=A0AAF3E9K8_9BILA